jgi:hypothetical protein
MRESKKSASCAAYILSSFFLLLPMQSNADAMRDRPIALAPESISFRETQILLSAPSPSPKPVRVAPDLSRAFDDLESVAVQSSFAEKNAANLRKALSSLRNNDARTFTEADTLVLSASIDRIERNDNMIPILREALGIFDAESRNPANSNSSKLWNPVLTARLAVLNLLSSETPNDLQVIQETITADREFLSSEHAAVNRRFDGLFHVSFGMKLDYVSKQTENFELHLAARHAFETALEKLDFKQDRKLISSLNKLLRADDYSSYFGTDRDINKSYYMTHVPATYHRFERAHY